MHAILNQACNKDSFCYEDVLNQAKFLMNRYN